MGSSKRVDVDFSDMGGGINTTDKPVDVRKDQATIGLNVKFRKRGFDRVPGFRGLNATPQFSKYIKGLHVYEKLDESEILLSMSGGKIYNTSTADSTLAELFEPTGTGEAWFANARGKCFVCNGTKMIKVESSTVAYQVGIDPPSGNSAAAQAGGSLAAGAYKVIAGYARNVAGSPVLYSRGEDLGTVTLSGGNGTVRVTLANSSDAQVNNKVIWMTDAAGTVYYFYAETNDNSTTTIDITDTSERNVFLNYTVDASLNYVPGAAEYIIFAGNRIFYTISNELYWSLEASGSVYDLEKFYTTGVGRKITYPFKITGMFNIGKDLYLNTEGGIIKLPQADPFSKYDLRSMQHFKFPGTIIVYEGIAYGFTQNGLEKFDGNNFFAFNQVPFSFSKDLKNEFNKMNAAFNDDHMPRGWIHRRADRTEYHVSFRDGSISNTVNNRHFVLNIDDIAIFESDSFKVPWEEWEGGVSHFAELKDGTLFYAQSKVDSGLIYKESAGEKDDRYVFNKTGVYLSDLTNKKMIVKSRTHIENLLGVTWWNKVHVLCQNRKPFKVTVYIDEKTGVLTSKTFTATDTNISRFGHARFGRSRFSVNKPQLQKEPLDRKIKGSMMYIEIEQTDNDTAFQLFNVIITGILKTTRLT